MKNKRLIIATITFFLLVNTTYYWEATLGLFAFPALLVLVIIYLVLVIALARQIYLGLKDRFAEKRSFLTIGLLIIVLSLTFYKPFGLIDFERLEGGDTLVAEREGAANCMTTCKLKDDYTFREKNVCFGVSETKGNFHLQNDTIFFDNVNLGRHEEGYYMFAVIKPSRFNKDGKHFDLTRYKGLTDTVGHDLWITKNELNKLKDKKPNR